MAIATNNAGARDACASDGIATKPTQNSTIAMIAGATAHLVRGAAHFDDAAVWFDALPFAPADLKRMGRSNALELFKLPG
mgnify:CR=1 FL=1